VSPPEFRPGDNHAKVPIPFLTHNDAIEVHGEIYEAAPHPREEVSPLLMEIKHPLPVRDVESPVHDTHSAGANSESLGSDIEPIIYGRGLSLSIL